MCVYIYIYRYPHTAEGENKNQQQQQKEIPQRNINQHLSNSEESGLNSKIQGHLELRLKICAVNQP